MYIKCEFTFNELKNACWSGAVNTLNDIAAAGLEGALMAHMEDVFYRNMPDMTEINDWLWFDRDSIYEYLQLA